MKLSPTNPNTCTIQVGETGIDYASRHMPLPPNNTKFVIRYLGPDMRNPKCVTTTELAQLTHNGYAVGLVYEGSGKEALKGYQQGIHDAALAGAAAKSVGWPPGLPIMFAVDFDVTPPTLRDAIEYIDGTGTLGYYSASIYGDSDILTAQGMARTDHCNVQTSNAWSHGVSPNAHMLQHVGGNRLYDTDVCVRETTLYYPHTTSNPQTPQQDITGDADMFTNKEPYTFGGNLYDPIRVFWRYNDNGQPVHITSTQEMMARGGPDNAQPFTNFELGGIPSLPTS